MTIIGRSLQNLKYQCKMLLCNFDGVFESFAACHVKCYWPKDKLHGRCHRIIKRSLRRRSENSSMWKTYTWLPDIQLLLSLLLTVIVVIVNWLEPIFKIFLIYCFVWRPNKLNAKAHYCENLLYRKSSLVNRLWWWKRPLVGRERFRRTYCKVHFSSSSLVASLNRREVLNINNLNITT